MGNHMVGFAFHVGMSNISHQEIDNMTQKQAYDFIKNIGDEVVKRTSLDAEFDDYLNADQKLGKIVIKAFFPSKYKQWTENPNLLENDDICDEWYQKVKKPFSELFGFW